jgi:hypothetical protein
MHLGLASFPNPTLYDLDDQMTVLISTFTRNATLINIEPSDYAMGMD